MFKGPRSWNFRFRGFTLMENMIVFLLVGIFAAMSAPSFAQMLDARKLDQSIAIVQNSLSAAHRQAIRNKDSCEVGVLSNQSSTNIDESISSSNIYSECLSEPDQLLGEKVIVVSNILPLEKSNALSDDEELVDNSKSKIGAEAFKWCVAHQSHDHDYWDAVCNRFKGAPDESPNFSQVVFNSTGGVFFGISSELSKPTDPSGKVVFYNKGQSQKKSKCLVLSRRLGLARMGSYRGTLEPKSITDSGECTARDWTKQYS